MSNQALDVCGMAYLCYIDGDDRFIGILITKDNRQFHLRSCLHSCSHEESALHDHDEDYHTCCFDDSWIEIDVTVSYVDANNYVSSSAANNTSSSTATYSGSSLAANSNSSGSQVNGSTSSQEVIIHQVKKSTEDNFSLISKHIHFLTDTLLVDREANVFIEKYIAPELVDKSALVCIGEMKIRYPEQFDKKLF